MKITAVTRDLMDRSKISAAFADVVVVRSADTALGDPDIVIVDLAIPGAVEAAVETGATVIGYGSHVDDDALEAARTLGADALPRSVFFRRLSEGTLLE